MTRLALAMVIGFIAAGPVLGQTARFYFVEGGPFEVAPDEVRTERLETSGGPCLVEMRLESGPPSEGVRAHWVVSLKNRGAVGDHGDPMQHVHPVWVELVMPVRPTATGVTLLDRTVAGRMGPSGVLDLADGGRIGLRDANLREPAAFIAEESRVVVRCLDDRPPTFGYPFWVAPWRGDTEPAGVAGEDPLSHRHHTLPGGRMPVPWHVLVIDRAARPRIESDLPPEIDAHTLSLAELLSPAQRAQRPPRLQRMLDSLASLGVRDEPGRGRLISDRPGQASFITMWVQGEARWATWNVDPELDLFDLPAGAQHLHWLSWPDVFWNDGHTNLHYSWTWTFLRHWLETRSPWSWWAFSRMAEWSLTAGLCWSADGSRHDYEGWPWYEKSTRGGARVYSGAFHGFPVASYKSFTRNQLAGWLVFREQPWAERGMAAHRRALVRMGYEEWDGLWGARIIAHGMMNHVTAWRGLGDETHRRLAVACAQRAIEASREPGRLATEPDERWRDAELGVPYWLNPAASVAQEANWFEQFKVLAGLVDVAEYAVRDAATKTLIERKIHQVVSFIREHGVVDADDLVLNRYKLTADRVPALYSHGTVVTNAPDATGFSRPWLVPGLGWAATHGDEASRTLLRRLHAQFAETIDWGPPLRFDFWEGRVTACAEGATPTIAVDGDLTDVSPERHGVRLAVDGSDAVAVVRIAVVRGRSLVVRAGDLSAPVRQALRSEPTRVTWSITGPHLEHVLSEKDKAIRRTVVDTGKRPDPARPFDYHAGQHYSSWSKMAAQPLFFGDLCTRLVADLPR